MNKYQMQVEHRTENKWDWICVFANSDQEAIQNAKIKLYDFQNPTYSQYDDYATKHWKDYYKEKFQGYIISPYTPIFSVERDCEPPKDYDTIISSSTKENQDMAFFKVNWNNYTEELSKKADTENWSNETYPNNGILTNYIVKTYDKLTDEKKIIIGTSYALFNTGLFTKYYEPIYAYQSGSEISFLTAYELGGIGITDRPERANYFENPDLLLFDWHYAIDVHYPHILEDKENQKRIPKEVLESKNIVITLDGAINKMKKKVSANYKLAIPQYYEGKIQLLLPLCLADDNIPDLALVVTKTNNVYRGHTCLTLDMAYNNARLIAKPESNWLNP
ncbi:DUF3825 domain-containing protein [Acetatifactor muris]|uniref:DUF3825 domain-containing protein n=1 Tax=Acetatifactor muris TaxID=879566 RepID=A0A2K4ZQA5_9FIRM|nr:DUF3825 domain-containing protein [Acetatifactor muris]MCR2051121.1 DUF3825 domain-containing protein [Acetatifactor muris]SOY32663.1 hypothetical protein AMURIS_05429 [Acetatifactor muris]